LFKKIGFNKILSIKKEREIYRLDDFELCIDKVDKIGDFIEIEILKQNFNRTKLNNLMKKLGLAEDLIIEETYPELLIKRKLKKENK
jgi:adenylate cyclase class 2